MAKIIYKHHLNAKDFSKIHEPVDGELLTEVAGYIPANIRIENIIQAGERLRAARAEMYDFGPGQEIDENFTDPTRKGDFDLSDATGLQTYLDGRYAEYKKQKEAVINTAKNTNKEQNGPNDEVMEKA